MSEELSVEATGETVGEAKWAAVKELERLAPTLDRDAIRFQVVSEGERGLLGVGFEPARVVATAPAPPRAAPAPPDSPWLSEEASLARELVTRAVAAIGASVTVRADEGPDEIVVTVEGDDLGVVIGRHGQTIDALQYLANAVAHRAIGELRRPVTVDAAGYRARRAVTLESLARRAAEQASATGRPVDLEAMTAVDRKVVHEVLKDDPEVTTTSEGSEPNRFVVVVPRRGI